MVVALVALVIAMGGTSYAAIELPANSVGTKQLKANAVVRAKVKLGGLRPADLNLGRIHVPIGPRGLRGPIGLSGLLGTAGPTGPPGPIGQLIVFRREIGHISPYSISCTNGRTATGGGAAARAGMLTVSRPTVNADGVSDGWLAASVATDGITPTFVEALVLCAG